MADQAITDQASGLFNEVFFRATFELRVAGARRLLRPVALVLVEVQGIEITALAEAVRSTLRDADVAARLDDGTVALILEDTPEDGAIWTTERLRRVTTGSDGAVLHAGIAGYPGQAFEAMTLLSQARGALSSPANGPKTE